MEKLPGGGCVFRGGRAEEKVQQIFQSKQQENMEKLYRKIEQEMEREEKEGLIGGLRASRGVRIRSILGRVGGQKKKMKRK